MLNHVLLYEKWVAEAFADKHPKNTYVNLHSSEVTEYADNIIELIKTAYTKKGGNLEFKNASDLRNSDLNYWIATDINDNPDADVLFGGKKTHAGTKMTVVAQDGSPEARKETVKKLIELMRTRGFYAELDVDMVQKFGLKPIKDEAEIRKVLNKDIKYNSDGSYDRKIAGENHTKMLVGIPKV